jgi:hypothetical protein
MKKISYLMIFASMLFLANSCIAQENTTTNQASKNVNAFFKNVVGEQASITDLTDNELFTDMAGFTVISFDVTMNIDGERYTLNTTGNKLSERQATLVRKQNPGDKVFIENIKCNDPEGNARFLSSLVFIIKK